jgi:hypothetical protein
VALPVSCALLFSSIAAVTGPAGSANYAAANASVDAIAHNLQTQGVSTALLKYLDHLPPARFVPAASALTTGTTVGDVVIFFQVFTFFRQHRLRPNILTPFWLLILGQLCWLEAVALLVCGVY